MAPSLPLSLSHALHLALPNSREAHCNIIRKWIKQRKNNIWANRKKPRQRTPKTKSSYYSMTKIIYMCVCVRIVNTLIAENATEKLQVKSKHIARWKEATELLLFNKEHKMENLFKFSSLCRLVSFFYFIESKNHLHIMYVCCFISAPFIFISRTYHLFLLDSNFFLLLLYSSLFSASFTPCRLYWPMRLLMPPCSLLILLTLKWKNGVINNFLTQFYVLISIVVCWLWHNNSNAYVIFQHPLHIHTTRKEKR